MASATFSPPPPSLQSIVPLLAVRSLPVSLDFYTRLGFHVFATSTPEGDTDPAWAELTNGRTRLMITRSDGDVTAHT